jgi:hypothetical protein
VQGGRHNGSDGLTASQSACDVPMVGRDLDDFDDLNITNNPSSRLLVFIYELSRLSVSYTL